MKSTGGLVAEENHENAKAGRRQDTNRKISIKVITMNVKFIKLMAFAALLWGITNHVSAALVGINLNIVAADVEGSSGWNGGDDNGAGTVNLADPGYVTSGSLIFSTVIESSDGGSINELKAGIVASAQNSGVNFNPANLKISAVPEPANYALAAFGLVFAGVGVGRCYLRRQRLFALSP